MNYIVNSLAQYEVHVARYYYRRGAYVAAINRAQQAVPDYQRVAGARRGAVHHGAVYDTLGLNELRDDAERVLEQELSRRASTSRAASVQGRSVVEALVSAG